MATKLLTVKEVADEAGISRQALEKHNPEPDFVANGRKLFRSADRVRGELIADRLAKNRKPHE